MVSKVENIDPKVQKQAETKRDGVINPQNYNFNQFYTDNCDALKRYESNNTTRNTCVIVVHGPCGSNVQSTTELGHGVRIYMLTVQMHRRSSIKHTCKNAWEIERSHFSRNFHSGNRSKRDRCSDIHVHGRHTYYIPSRCSKERTSYA